MRPVQAQGIIVSRSTYAGWSTHAKRHAERRSRATRQRLRSASPSSRCLEATSVVLIPTTNPDRLALDCASLIRAPAARNACQPACRHRERDRRSGPGKGTRFFFIPGNLLRTQSDMSSVHSGASKRKTSSSRHTTVPESPLQEAISCPPGCHVREGLRGGRARGGAIPW